MARMSLTTPEIACSSQMVVKAMMLAAMNGFLLDERPDFVLQFLWHAFAKLLDRVDEKFLAFWKGNRKRIEKGGREGIPANPATALDHGAGEIAIAGSDIETGGRCTFVLRVRAGRCISDFGGDCHSCLCTSQYFDKPARPSFG